MNLYFSLALFVGSLFLGMYLENEFHLASQTSQAYHELTVAQKGEASIIKDTQTFNKDLNNDKKDPCLSDTVPSDINKLLH